MAPIQSSPFSPSVEHSMALETSFACHQGLTPPDSPTKGTTTSQAILKDLKHLFGVFLEKTLLDLTNKEPPNTPVSQGHFPPGPNMIRLKQLLVKLTCDECASAELFVATEPAQSCPASNKQEGVRVTDEIDLDSPICTTPDDFKSFEKWASTPQFKTVLETYEPLTPYPIPFRNRRTRVQLGQRSMQIQNSRAGGDPQWSGRLC